MKEDIDESVGVLEKAIAIAMDAHRGQIQAFIIIAHRLKSVRYCYKRQLFFQKR